MTLLTKFPRLLFSLEDDAIHLRVDERLIIPFKDLDEWEKFAQKMLDMMPEILENIEQS